MCGEVKTNSLCEQPTNGRLNTIVELLLKEQGVQVLHWASQTRDLTWEM